MLEQRGDRASDDMFAEDNLALSRALAALWASRRMIAAVSLLGAMAGLGLGLTATRVYTTRAVLSVAPSKLAESDSLIAVAPANFLPIVASGQIGATIVEEFGLSGPPFEMTSGDYLRSGFSVQEVRNTSLLLIQVSLRDAQLAARVANRHAELAMDLARELNQRETVEIRDLLKGQVDDARQRLERTEAELMQYRTKAQLELLRKDVESALAERQGLLGLMVRTETERAKLRRAETELAARERLTTVSRAIDNDPALMESARAQGRDGRELLTLRLRSELPNPTYEALDQIVATSRATLAAMERQQGEMQQRGLVKQSLGILTELYERDAEIARREMERDLAREVYKEVAMRFERARIQVAGRSAQLQVVDPATPPQRPDSRRVAVKVGIGLIAGLLLATAGVLWRAMAKLAE